MKNQYFLFAKKLVTAYITDDAFTKGAALAYYTAFSLGPVIVIMISLGGYFFGQQAIEGELYAQLAGLLGPTAASGIQEIVEASYTSDDSWWATILSSVALIFGATGAFSQLKFSLDAVFGVEAKPANSFIGFLAVRITAFSLILSLGFLLLVSLVLNALAVSASRFFSATLFSVDLYYYEILSFIVSLFLTTSVLSCIFKFLPAIHLRWVEAIWGGLFTAVLFIVGQAGIGFYIGNSSVLTGYGAAGSIIALLVWTYYSSQIVFLGAEFTYVLAEKNGNPVLPSTNALKVVKTTKKIETKE